MNNDFSSKRILSVQDVSCLGQCSMTVALPIIAACGIETCILPSAILSTHTGGFKGFTFHDLCDEFPKIINHWKSEKLLFDALYTGYLGNCDHVKYVTEIAENLISNGGKIIIDPAMADNGKLYYGFDAAYVDSIKELCKKADVLLPNITEACYLADIPYIENITKKDAENLALKLAEKYSADIVLTGVGYDSATTGILICSDGKIEYYAHRLVSQSFHGTGDVFSSAFVGAYLNGKSLLKSSKIAADFTVAAIENTVEDKSHWYGVKFEQILPKLIKSVK